MQLLLALPLVLALPFGFAVKHRYVRSPRTLARKTDNYKLRLDNFQNVQYYSSLTLGDQQLPVIYDTGSFEVLALSEYCKKCAHELIKYDSALSKTFRKGEAITAEHHFGSGSVLSLKSIETVRMGPVDSPLIAHNLPFWQVMDHEIAVWNSEARFSGIVGLGHTDKIPEGYGDEGANGRDTTLLNALKVRAFAICLGRKQPGDPGWLVVNPTINSVPGMFVSVPVVGKIHWGVEMREFGVSDAHYNLCTPSCGAIVDSGTSLIAAPASVLNELSPLLNSIKEDCSNMNSLPSLQFNLGSKSFSLPPQAYVMQVEQPGNSNSSIWDTIWGTNKPKNRVVCAPAFMQIEKMSQYGPVVILGMPFLRYYYTVFDRESNMLEIADAAPDCSVSPPGMMFSNLSSAVGTGAAAKTGTRAFTTADYKPLRVDVGAMRAPNWAFSKDPHFVF